MQFFSVVGIITVLAVLAALFFFTRAVVRSYKLGQAEGRAAVEADKALAGMYGAKVHTLADGTFLYIPFIYEFEMGSLYKTRIAKQDEKVTTIERAREMVAEHKAKKVVSTETILL